MRRITLAIAVLGTLFLFTACGIDPNFVPVFSTTPPLTAVENIPYTYTFQVGGPPYAPLLSRLTTAPEGATLSGNTIYWTPTAEQSCAPNYFVLTVTAPGGPSASQSWTVGAVCVPVFSSSAPLAAEQDNTYTYSLDATAPHGMPVTFQLTAAPTGATLSGDVLTWTPTAKQSRTANQFEVTATAGGGGTATQSWTVNPNGTISGSCIDNYWGANGNVKVDQDLSAFTIIAKVPQADGSNLNITGTGNTDGTFVIPNVPAGFYTLWLQASSASTAYLYWTNSSTFDCGTDYAGRQPGSTINGSLSLNLTGLSKWATGDVLELTSPNAGVYCDLVAPPTVASICSVSSSPSPGDQAFTTADAQVFNGPPIDPSQDDTSFLLQYESLSGDAASSVTVKSDLVLGPALALSQPPLMLTSTDSDAPISGALSAPASTAGSTDVTVDGSAWGAAYAVQASASSTASDFFVDLAVQPIVVGQQIAGGAPLELVSLDVSQVATGVPDLGSQTYNNPFPSAWPLVFSAYGGSCDSAYNVCAEVGYSTTVLPTAAITPPMTPVSTPTLNSENLFTTKETASPVLALSWGTPGGLAPYGFGVYVYEVNPANGLQMVFYTTQTAVGITLDSTTFPANNTFVFVIRALADGGLANLETAPNHWKYPTAYADVISGPVTIGGGTSSAATRIKALKLQSQSQPPASTQSLRQQ